jgi:excisionase family DNA binding protein
VTKPPTHAKLEQAAERRIEAWGKVFGENAPIWEPWEVHTRSRRKRKPRVAVPDGLRDTADQAAAILGIPRRTVQALAARGELPGAAKIGRLWTFDIEKLRRLVRQRERETWQSARHRPDVFGAATPFTVAFGSVGDSSGGRLKQMIQQSRKRVGKLVKSER